ncbi:MAG: PAS domain-containing sensor histidine kinase [Bacteriovoracaceae bacterium]|nr:PAS domain-containing sensor histidine kinase [Bacteriovoracaceae bacterium]
MPNSATDPALEQQLKQSRESLDFALQSGRMGTWDINLVNNSIACSQLMLDLWGVTAKELNGNRAILQKKVHPDDLQRMNSSIDEAIKNDSIYELEFRIIPSPGKERWVMSRGRCTYDSDLKTPSRFSGVVFDITEKKIKEEKLTAALKARDQFFMIANHELRTPLTCLELHHQVMELELKLNYPDVFSTEILKSGFQKQKDNLQRITRLVNNILDESQIASGSLSIQPEHFDLCEMAREVVDRFKIIAESAGVEVRFTITQSVPGKWDRFRLEQVLLNLLTNAIRYGNKTPIHIEIKGDEEKGVMIVRDNGLGINSEDQKRVFEQFERATGDNNTNGLGLGLFISNSIIKAHGGEISLKSEIGKGAEFAVVLPRFPG